MAEVIHLTSKSFQAIFGHLDENPANRTSYSEELHIFWGKDYLSEHSEMLILSSKIKIMYTYPGLKSSVGVSFLYCVIVILIVTKRKVYIWYIFFLAVFFIYMQLRFLDLKTNFFNRFLLVTLFYHDRFSSQKTYMQ